MAFCSSIGRPSSPTFSECVSYALRKLQISDISLKAEQRSSMKAIFDGQDVFVWLPTGYGKSLCYQALPFLMDFKGAVVDSDNPSAVLVISPLLALMIDQVKSLRSRGVKCSIITSSGGGIEKDLLGTESSLSGDSLLFCTPEALVRSKWRYAIEDTKVCSRIVALVIDEAHCVSKWSKDFRPSFSRLAEVRSLIPPGTPCMACTATATKSVREQVVQSLEMIDYVCVSVSPDRPNIFYEVKRRTDIESDFADLIGALQTKLLDTPRVLVYCQSLNTCSDLFAHFLYHVGPASYYPPGAAEVSDKRLFGMYHSCTPQYNKDVILESLRNPKGVVRVVFATVALGMGIDLQDVNTIIHYGAPRSLEDYFQESGRGGRSGNDARSVVFWKPCDCPVKAKPLTTHDQELIDVRRYLENTSECRRNILLKHFDFSFASLGKDSTKCCDVCANKQE